MRQISLTDYFCKGLLRHDIAVQPVAQPDGLPQNQLDSPANLRAFSVYHGGADGCRIAALVLTLQNKTKVV